MPPRFVPPADLSCFDAFIFDCDGTLVDSMPAHYIAWTESLRAAGANFDFTWEEFLSRAGMSLHRTADELELKYSCTLDRLTLALAKAQAYQRVALAIRPINAVVDFARSLSGKYPLAVATGSDRGEVEQVLVRLNLRHLFSELITPADVQHGKPEPEMFLLAAARLHTLPERCLVIEDGESGFEAANRANMQCAKVMPAAPPRTLS